MKCASCGRPVKLLQPKKFTATGVLCPECHDSTVAIALDDMRCSACGAKIRPGDSYAPTQKRGPLCLNCFETVTLTSCLSSKFMLVFGLLVILFGLTAGILRLFFAQVDIVMGLACIIIGAAFIGLAKIVEAAEVYVIKNRQT